MSSAILMCPRRARSCSAGCCGPHANNCESAFHLPTGTVIYSRDPKSLSKGLWMATLSVVASVAPRGRSLSRRVRAALLVLLALGVFAGGFAFLNSWPVIALDRARGL